MWSDDIIVLNRLHETISLSCQDNISNDRPSCIVGLTKFRLLSKAYFHLTYNIFRIQLCMYVAIGLDEIVTYDIAYECVVMYYFGW